MKKFFGSDDEEMVIPSSQHSITQLPFYSDGEDDESDRSLSPPRSAERNFIEGDALRIAEALQTPTSQELWEDVLEIPSDRLRNLAEYTYFKDGFTILHVVAVSGDARLIALLLDHGAQMWVDVFADNPENQDSPLTCAVQSCKREAVELLLPYSLHASDALCAAIVEYKNNPDLDSDLHLRQKEMLSWLFTRPEIVGSECLRDYPSNAPKIPSCVNLPDQRTGLTALQLAAFFFDKNLFEDILKLIPETPDNELSEQMPLIAKENTILNLAVSAACPYIEHEIDFIRFLFNKNPRWARCPITGAIMVHPVKAADGYAYEFMAMRQLIKQTPQGPVISPVTGCALENLSLKWEPTLEVGIQRWLKTQSEADQSKYKTITKQYDLVTTAMQGLSFGHLSPFFDQLPPDFRIMLIQKYFSSFGEADKKHLKQANIRGISLFFYQAIEPAKAKIKEYFDLMITGNFKASEAMLKKDPGLAVERMTITDLSGRIFKDITGFQYAVWARFTRITKIIAGYMTFEQAQQQFHQQMDPQNENVMNHGPICLAVDEWEEKCGDLHRKYSKMDLEQIMGCQEEFIKDYVEVREAQEKQTAEVRLRMLEEDEDAGWLSGDVQKAVLWNKDVVTRWSLKDSVTKGVWVRGCKGECRLGGEDFEDFAYDIGILAKIKQNQSNVLAELESMYGPATSPSFVPSGL